MQPGGDNLNPIRVGLFVIAAAGLASGLLAPLVGLGAVQNWVWGAAAGAVLAVLLYEIVTSLMKGEVGLDIVAGGQWRPVPNVGVQVGYRALFLDIESGRDDEAFEVGSASLQGLFAGVGFRF